MDLSWLEPAIVVTDSACCLVDHHATHHKHSTSLLVCAHCAGFRVKPCVRCSIVHYVETLNKPLLHNNLWHYGLVSYHIIVALPKYY